MNKKTILFYTILLLFTYNKTYSQVESIITSPDNSSFNRADDFGYDTSIYENKVLIGAIYDESQFGETGAAYVYKFNGNDWELEQKLAPNNGSGTFNGLFGVRVELSDNIAFISAPFHDDKKGAVYIFEFDGNQWNQTFKLMSSDGITKDKFGQRISYNNNRILISNGRNDGVIRDRNWVYVFEKENDNWVEKAKLIPADGVKGGGVEVKLFNNMAVIADEHFFDVVTQRDGAVFTFLFNNNEWTESAAIYKDTSIINFGVSVGLGDNLLAVGSSFDVFVYEFINNQWSYVTTFEYPEIFGSTYAHGIDIDGEKILVGSFLEEATLYVKENNNDWSKKITLKPSDKEDFDIFRYGFWNVSVNGNRISIGAPLWHDGNTPANGGAYIYDLQNTLTVTENDFLNKVYLYPNPVNNKVMLSENLRDRVSKIEIFDISGRKLVSTTEYSKELDVSNFSKAIYLVKIKINDGSTIVKRIVKR